MEWHPGLEIFGTKFSEKKIEKTDITKVPRPFKVNLFNSNFTMKSGGKRNCVQKSLKLLC